MRGSIDGQPPVTMLVNLGAGLEILSTDLGRRFVAVNGKYVSLRLTGERMDLPIGKVASFDLGTVAIDAPHVGIWKGLGRHRNRRPDWSDGVSHHRDHLDFHNDQIVIEDAQSFPDRIRPAVRLPIVLQDDLGIVLSAVFARFDFGNGKTGLCEIDTGSQGITLDKTFASAIGLDPNAASGRLATSACTARPKRRWRAGGALRRSDLRL